ncbi:cytochrome P450 [Catellatospora vulcania]|uniref:cytochrome P450 n=1 Tax=Catellatospora vulcania TaxID=1460450 RepID=UPI0012D37995|nr:cytochrome P450 [Catellatospora vulcania]
MSTAATFQALRTEEGRRNPYPHYAALHATGPVAPLTGSYAASVHGYDAVCRVLRDPAFRVLDAERLSRLMPSWQEHPSLTVLMNSIMFTNGDQHARKRRLITREFTARRVAALADTVTSQVDRLLDGIAELGASGAQVDFMKEFAFPLPSNVIGELLGVPAEDRAWFQPHVTAIGAVLDAGGDSKYPPADKAAAELSAYFADLVRQRRQDPRDDLVTLLSAAGEDEDTLTHEELLSALVLVFNAGFETTTHLLGNGLEVLLRHPAAAKRLREQPELAAPYVDEFLRLEAPAQLTTRWTAVDTEIEGVAVPAGSTVLVLLGAANRDPARFPEPDEFRPDRADNAHLTFSAGAHFCPGALLTTTEAQLAFPRLLARFPGLALAGEPVYRSQLTLRGHTHLPITVA